MGQQLLMDYMKPNKAMLHFLLLNHFYSFIQTKEGGWKNVGGEKEKRDGVGVGVGGGRAR